MKLNIGARAGRASAKARSLTAADRAALEALPDEGWFIAATAPIARAAFRCERLAAAGQLERRVADATPAEHATAPTEFRRLPKPVADWSVAPEGATHVMRNPGAERSVWLRIDGPFDAFWRWPNASGWRRSSSSSSELLRSRSVEPRPGLISAEPEGTCVEVKSTEYSPEDARREILLTASTAVAKDLTVHLDLCIAISGLPGCTCQQIENEAMHERYRNLLEHIPQQSQRQDSTQAQLADLHAFANRLGLYDAADAIKVMLAR